MDPLHSDEAEFSDSTKLELIVGERKQRVLPDPRLWGLALLLICAPSTLVSNRWGGAIQNIRTDFGASVPSVYGRVASVPYQVWISGCVVGLLLLGYGLVRRGRGRVGGTVVLTVCGLMGGLIAIGFMVPVLDTLNKIR